MDGIVSSLRSRLGLQSQSSGPAEQSSTATMGTAHVDYTETAAAHGAEQSHSVVAPLEDQQDEDGDSTQERIYRLVDRHGGEMWQSDVVEADSWSKSLVSRRLSELEERGWVRRVQKGRQKAVFTLARD